MRYYVKSYFYDDLPIVEYFDTADEAGECFQASVDQRRDCGVSSGDVAQIIMGIQHSGGLRSIKSSVEFQ
jgi:hypothetical protein